MFVDVDAAVVVPVNIVPLQDLAGNIQSSVAYNAAGMALKWNFVTSAGVTTQTAVTPTTGGVYDWTHLGGGIYSIEIPASGGASINNDAEGTGWFSGSATGVLPWSGPKIVFRAAGLNNKLIDEAYDSNRGLAGAALPGAAAEAAGGLFTRGSGAGQIAQSNNGRIDADTKSLAADSITATAIQNDAITAAKIATGAIDADAIADGAIDAGAIAADAITSAKIADGAITAAKVADGAIDAATFATGAITADAIAADAIGSSELAASAVTEIQSGLSTLDAAGVRTAVGLASANLDTQLSSIATNITTLLSRITSTLFTGITSLAEWLGLIAGKQTGNSTARTELRSTGAGSGSYDEATDSQEALRDTIGTPAGVSVSADISAIEAQTDDIGAAGAGLTAIPWNASWDAEVQSEVQDALDAILADSVPADGTRPSLAQAVYMITQFLTERAVSGTTVTVKKVDGSTTLMTLTINDASSPTSITRTT